MQGWTIADNVLMPQLRHSDNLTYCHLRKMVLKAVGEDGGSRWVDVCAQFYADRGCRVLTAKDLMYCYINGTDGDMVVRRVAGTVEARVNGLNDWV